MKPTAGRLLRGLEGLAEVQTLHLHVDRLRKEEEGVEEPERFADNAEVTGWERTCEFTWSSGCCRWRWFRR